MFLFTLVIFVGSVVFGAVPALADRPTPSEIIRQMKATLEPDRPSVRQITITRRGNNDQRARWTAMKASKTMQDGKGTLLIMLSPESMRGSTHLMIEREDGPVVMWTYSPATQRVRKIFAADAEDDFLGTELRLADLGLLSRRGEYIFLGEEEYLGKQTYKLSFVPYTPVYDSRIFTWVDAESLLPFQREYYDGDDKLRKVERFEKITHLNGIPTPVLIQREDARDGTGTEFRVTAVRYDVNVPDELFDPKKLVQAANSPFWQEHMAQVDASK